MNVAATLHDRLRTDQEKVLSGYAYVELTGCDLGLKFAHTVTGEVHNLGNGQPFGDLAAGFAHGKVVGSFNASRHRYAFQPADLHKNLFSFHQLWFKITVTL